MLLRLLTWLLGGGPTTRYEESAALLLKNLSDVAYYSAAEVIPWTCPPCRGVHGVLRATVVQSSTERVQAVVVHARGWRAVAFRGSTEPQNFLDDLRLHAHPLGNDSAAAVHGGFLRAWLALRSQLLPLVLSAGPPLYVTGHSLGGALAVLCACDLASLHSITVRGVYTYGAPRVGNAEFARWCQRRSGPVVWRLVHWRDPVPHLPPRSFGYVHGAGAREVFLPRDDRPPVAGRRLCSPTGYDARCSDQFRLAGTTLRDHLRYFGRPIGTRCCPSP